MIIQSGNVDESLKDVVKEYYFFSNTEDSSKYVPVIDDCCYDIIFFKEANTSLTFGPRNKEIRLQYPIFTIHDLKPPYTLKFENSLNFFTIKIQPWFNAYFFGSIEQSGIIDIGSSNDRFIEFFDKVFRINELDKKFELANLLMAQDQPSMNDKTQLIQEICLYIYEMKGIVSVNEISIKFKRSRQYIGKLFKQHVLYSIKKFIITVRILDLIKHRKNRKDLSLTELTYQYNYFDQSHFIKDFKQVCGVTPTIFFNDLPKFFLRH